MALILSILLGFIPMLAYAAFVYWMDHFEKEPLRLLGGVFVWGVIVAAGGAYILNTLFGVSIYLLTGSEGASNIGTAVISAPFIEESLKGLAILLVFLFVRHEFDSILDGIVYAAVTALGFAATENTLYIYEKGFLAEGWSGLWFMGFIRIMVVGWQHPFYTAFTGIGLSISRLSKNNWIKWIAPVGGWFASVATHTLHNLIASFGIPLLCIAGSILDWSGWIAMFTFLLYTLWREKKWIITYLYEEVSLGTLTQNQYTSAGSLMRRLAIPWIALFAGKYKNSIRFYQVCAELAHKKRQFSRLGEEGGNGRTILSLRNELKRLSSQVVT